MFMVAVNKHIGINLIRAFHIMLCIITLIIKDNCTSRFAPKGKCLFQEINLKNLSAGLKKKRKKTYTKIVQTT